MREQLISVIIPCYNTEKYLSKCIESVLNQTYSNLEIILINDGSTDNSLAIMQKYAKENKKISIIDQQNKGVAYSRNLGISAANGEYVIFVDSDDFVSKYYCEALYNAIQENKADIAMCHVTKILENQVPEEKEINTLGKTYTKTETIYNLIKHGDFYDFPVAKLYSKKALKNVKFPIGRIYEDSATMPIVYANIDRAVVLEDAYYFYVQRENSITTAKYVMKNLNDNYLAIHDRYIFLSANVPEMKDVIISGYIRNILTIFDRVYLIADEELIHSEIVTNLEAELKTLIEDVDKNVLFQILNNYLATLFLLLQSKEVYIKSIKELYENRSKK